MHKSDIYYALKGLPFVPAVERVYYSLQAVARRRKWQGEHRIFCISFQRTGTTSTGAFFRELGYPTAGWNEARAGKWGKLWFDGKYDELFAQAMFKGNQAFEDGPFWAQDFYKELHRRFPDAKFVLLKRDPDKWFDSMISHSGGMSLGRTEVHARVYGREDELAALQKQQKVPEMNGLSLDGQREKYKAIYVARNAAAEEYFAANAPDSLFVDTLENPQKWENMARFLGHSLDGSAEFHKNYSR